MARTNAPDDPTNEDEATDETLVQLEKDSALWDQFVQAIRGSDPSNDGDLAASLRGVDSREELKRRLDQLTTLECNGERAAEQAAS